MWARIFAEDVATKPRLLGSASQGEEFSDRACNSARSLFLACFANKVPTLGVLHFRAQRPQSCSDGCLATLAGLTDSMKMAREHALLGNYEAALVYHDGVIAQIQQHLKTLDDPHLRQQWVRAKEEINSEFGVVKEIARELARFKDPPGGASAAGGAAAHDDDEPCFRRPLPPRRGSGGGGRLRRWRRRRRRRWAGTVSPLGKFARR